MPAPLSPTANPVQYYLDRNAELESIKKPWLPHYQSLAEIFLTRKMDFTRMLVPGEFLQASVFDNTGQFAAYLMASIFLSMMWPDSSRTIEIEPSRRLKGMPGVEAYFRFVTDEVRDAMDNPKAGFQSALMEYFLDQGVFGTSGLETRENTDPNDLTLPVTYSAWSIKTMCISENAQGIVDTVYYKRQMTVQQVVAEYGTGEKGNRISPKVQELFDNKKFDEKIDVLFVIEPKLADATKRGRAAMSVRTLHIDMTYKFKMREGGQHEMMVSVGRFFKTQDEPYGRSSGMIALPDADSLNALTEAVIVASEKQLDPPLIVMDSGRLGGGVVDTSAHGITVYDSTGRLGNEKPIAPLFTIGEMTSPEKLQVRFEQKIMSAFFLDRLLDLNNKTQMTAYETSIRDRLRGEGLGSIFSRQKTEVVTPTVEKTFNALYRRGQLGIVATGIGARVRQLWAKITGSNVVIVPQAVIEATRAGLDVFQVRYISPAERFMQAEKLQGLFTAVDAIVALAPVIPGFADNIDERNTAEDIFRFSGAPMRDLRTVDDVLRFRAAARQKQAQAEKLAEAEQASKIGLNTSNARAALGTVKGPAGQ